MSRSTQPGEQPVPRGRPPGRRALRRGSRGLLALHSTNTPGRRAVRGCSCCAALGAPLSLAGVLDVLADDPAVRAALQAALSGSSPAYLDLTAPSPMRPFLIAAL